MFSKVILTFSTRVMTALLSIVNVLIGTNYLGVEGYGTISLIILGITIYLMFQNLLTGSSIIYFTSKITPSAVLAISYTWVGISVLFFAALIQIVIWLTGMFQWTFEIVPEQYKWDNVLLAAGYGLMNIHLNLLLGRERIKSFNLIFFLQHLICTLLLIWFYLIMDHHTIDYYLTALYVSYFSSFLLAFFFTYGYFREWKSPTLVDFKKMLKYGVLGQSANVFQLINYRLSYYLIDIFIGRASLGIFSAATQISEGLWIFGKSIATVQFAHISNLKEPQNAGKLTMRLLKFTVTVTLLPLILLFILPPSFYQWLLGEEFTGVKEIIVWLSLGTISLSASMILSHYFSGIGQIAQNTKSSGIAVLVTVILGFTLIPLIGINGAALVSSLSYLTSLIFLIIIFNRRNPIRPADFVLSIDDFRETYTLLVDKIQSRRS